MNDYSPSWRKRILVVGVMALFFMGLYGAYFLFNVNQELAKITSGKMMFDIIFFIILLFSFFFIISILTLGFRISVTEDEIIYNPGYLFRLATFNRCNKRIKIDEIQEVYFGTPKRNKMATFGAININSADEEITFNTDLFESRKLKNLLTELKIKNPRISFDRSVNALMKEGKTRFKFFGKEIIKNLFYTALLMIAFAILTILIYKLNIIPKWLLWTLFTAELLFLPFIFNKLKTLTRKR